MVGLRRNDRLMTASAECLAGLPFPCSRGAHSTPTPSDSGSSQHLCAILIPIFAVSFPSCSNPECYWQGPFPPISSMQPVSHGSHPGRKLFMLEIIQRCKTPSESCLPLSNAILTPEFSRDPAAGQSHLQVPQLTGKKHISWE